MIAHRKLTNGRPVIAKVQVRIINYTIVGLGYQWLVSVASTYAIWNGSRSHMWPLCFCLFRFRDRILPSYLARALELWESPRRRRLKRWRAMIRATAHDGSGPILCNSSVLVPLVAPDWVRTDRIFAKSVGIGLSTIIGTWEVLLWMNRVFVIPPLSAERSPSLVFHFCLYHKYDKNKLIAGGEVCSKF